MAYNSDGYIMFDFSGVNFARTNQTIDGIYQKCRDIIGTNKFIIVINANRKTPLPSVCSFVNNQYVIESVLYSFTISSNDNLLIKKNTSASELIDDDHVSTSTTYSSIKINNIVNGIIDDLLPLQFIEKTGTLRIGDNVITWDDEMITSNMWVFPFTSEYGLNPTTVTCTNGHCSMFFDSAFDHSIKVGLRLYKPLTTGD